MNLRDAWRETEPKHTARVLVWDIETRPATATVFQLRGNDWISPDKITDHGGVLGVACRWLDSPEIMWRADWHDGGHDGMIRWFWALQDQADVSVTYNGVNFDVKHMNREYAILGLPRPTPSREIDLLRVARKRFAFLSNKLDYIAQQLGVGAKLEHQGYGLWKGCMEGDPAARALMGQYAKQDVRLTTDLYRRLLPWLDGAANLALWTGQETACPSCGGTNLERTSRQWVATAQTRYAEYRCGDCGQLTRTNYVGARSLSRTPN